MDPNTMYGGKTMSDWLAMINGSGSGFGGLTLAPLNPSNIDVNPDATANPTQPGSTITQTLNDNSGPYGITFGDGSTTPKPAVGGPPPPPSPNDPATNALLQDAQKNQQIEAGRGRAATILNSGRGLLSSNMSSRRVLLGS